MKNVIFSLGCLAGSLCGMPLQAEEADVEVSYRDPRDPFESFNRVMWDLNYKVLDRYIARPVAHAYSDYVPQMARNGVDNFVHNFNEPFSAVNNLLQGKGHWAANATARFLLNTTIGIGGLFDMAETVGLPRKQDQFGEVLGYWGVSDGPYLMLPVLGPGTVRDEFGDLIDGLYFPFDLLNFWQGIGLFTLDGLNTRSQLIEQEGLLDNALDTYTFTKEAYFQFAEFQLYDGEPPQQVENEQDAFLDDFLDELE